MINRCSDSLAFLLSARFRSFCTSRQYIRVDERASEWAGKCTRAQSSCVHACTDAAAEYNSGNTMELGQSCFDGRLRSLYLATAPFRHRHANFYFWKHLILEVRSFFIRFDVREILGTNCELWKLDIHD